MRNNKNGVFSSLERFNYKNINLFAGNLLVTCWPFAGNLHEKRSKTVSEAFLSVERSFTLKRNKNGRKVEKRSSVGLSRRCRGAQEGSHHNKEEHSKEHHTTTPGKESLF